MTATGPVPARCHRLKRGREASKFVGTQASTHAELHPDNSRDQIHVQTPGQNCVLGLQSSPSSSAVYSLPFSSRKHYPKSFFFLLFFFGSPLVIQHHFLQGAKGFINLPVPGESKFPPVPCYLRLWDHFAVQSPWKVGCRVFDPFVNGPVSSAKASEWVDVKRCVTRGQNLPLLPGFFHYFFQSPKFQCFRSLCGTPYPAIIPFQVSLLFVSSSNFNYKLLQGRAISSCGLFNSDQNEAGTEAVVRAETHARKF